MKEINEEIKLTLNLMQTDIDDGAHDELQKHLSGLLEIKRNELQQRLVERSWLDNTDGMGSVVKFDQAPYKSVKLDGQVEAKPLTAEELKAGGWWCADTSETARQAFELRGFRVTDQWELEDLDGCFLGDKESVARFRGISKTKDLREIHRIGNDFYWSE